MKVSFLLDARYVAAHNCAEILAWYRSRVAISVPEHLPRFGTRVGASCFAFDSDRSLSFAFELDVYGSHTVR